MAEPKRPFAVELLLVYRGELFMLLRDDKPNIAAPFRWSLLSGAVEIGETPDQAMAREIKEEIDIEIPFARLATTARATWYYGELLDADVALIRQGEGCGRGFFSMDALRGLATISGKGGLGGTIRRLTLKRPDTIFWLLRDNTLPSQAELTF